MKREAADIRHPHQARPAGRDRPALPMVKEITIDTALTWEDPPDGGHVPVVDPYEGCTIGCPYCFLLNDGEWPGDVLAKVNMPDRIRKDLANWPGDEPLYIGSRCDPYMPVEKHYGLTRECLIALSELQIPCFMCTKADPDLVSRDLDVMVNYQAEFTVVLGLVNLPQLVSAGSSGKTKNIEFARRLHTLGIRVWAFVMPVLPGITDVRLMMDALPDDIPFWLYNLQARTDSENGRRLLAFIGQHYPHLLDLYKEMLQGGEDIYYRQLKEELQGSPRANFPYG